MESYYKLVSNKFLHPLYVIKSISYDDTATLLLQTLFKHAIVIIRNKTTIKFKTKKYGICTLVKIDTSKLTEEELNLGIIEKFSMSKLNTFKQHKRLKVFYIKGVQCVSCPMKGNKLVYRIVYMKDKGLYNVHVDIFTNDNKMMTVDHIHPKSKGGTNNITNLQPMCGKCNQLKGDKIMSTELVEKLSSIQHDIWSHWMKYMFSISELNADGTITINKQNVERWTKQLNTTYELVSEKEKESDRSQVEKFLHLLTNIKL